MKKVKRQKLKLEKERLRTLSATALQDVAGGTLTAVSCLSGCGGHASRKRC